VTGGTAAGSGAHSGWTAAGPWRLAPPRRRPWRPRAGDPRRAKAGRDVIWAVLRCAGARAPGRGLGRPGCAGRGLREVIWAVLRCAGARAPGRGLGRPGCAGRELREVIWAVLRYAGRGLRECAGESGYGSYGRDAVLAGPQNAGGCWPPARVPAGELRWSDAGGCLRRTPGPHPAGRRPAARDTRPQAI
jgi:hypothetical protein